MPDLPTGTVTFLFTDIEGSTALLEAHPAAYRGAVRRHHALLRGAVAGHGGAVFETAGDALYAASRGGTPGRALLRGAALPDIRVRRGGGPPVPASGLVPPGYRKRRRTFGAASPQRKVEWRGAADSKKGAPQWQQML
jgi:hypothetical protein